MSNNKESINEVHWPKDLGFTPTIDDVRPPDRHLGYPKRVPRWYTKLFEALPAAITWGLVVTPIIAALLKRPELFIYFMSFFTVYWGIQAALFMVGAVKGYLRYTKEVEIDWNQKIKDEGFSNEADKMDFVYIHPLYNEGYEIIEPALKSWSESDIGAKRISLVFALEERYAEKVLKDIEKAVKKHGHKFKEVKTFIHPQNIEGEIKGVKTGNINWATRRFVDEVKARGEKLEDYLLITCDSDQRAHPKYLSSILYKYQVTPKPKQTVYVTAVHTFSNNIWRVPSIVRIMFNFVTLGVLYRWGLFTQDANETFSSYVVNLETLEKIHFWDPQLENDDTVFYWNARTRFSGDFKSVAVYVPTYNDAVENKDVLNTYKSLWRQQVRWGWGNIVFPMTWSAIYDNKEMKRKEKFKIFKMMFDERLLFRSAAYLITFGVPLLTLLSPEFRYSSASYLLPQIMSVILTIAIFFNIPLYIIRRKIVPPPKGWGIFRNILDIAEIGLLTVMLLTYGFLPTIQALTAMVFRKNPKMEHYVTDKVAITK